MKTSIKLFTILISFLFINTAFAKDKPISNSEDAAKVELMNKFNQEFSIGEATYKGSTVHVEVELKELAIQLGWTPTMFNEYSSTVDGKATYQQFCEFIKEAHTDSFLEAGFNQVEIRLVYLDEIKDVYASTL
ncbi:hypothetical protein [Flammeovirga kamogawensis]|uniref:Uncharacterized protein n=1 Tax=Flammeovirga kamogawensis TaxID=373891 RepID=A0ABX8GQ54_9BACT|nr:hypothetical protein [Flammeovirga kamogawensis]MBB6463080.1 hypothetical protein [Flammeovirga kamogawensis]QWG05715.1 hypothetical protein KM029_10000 [Flammeovirga kamogawensis]TRX67544.1 hypothetical protein EO216_05030 [Flammeovirga kamogawensis]